ncbi:MAG: DegT/DnrJ/EryC1/StrS family aminotransferase, partial [Pseudomonadota bacterium]
LARAYYDPPLHRKPMKYPHTPAVLETTDELAKRFISLPCGAHVSTDDIEKVADFLSFLSEAGDEISARLEKELDVAGV